MFCNVFTYTKNSSAECVDISLAYKAGYCFIFNLYLLFLSASDDDSELEVIEFLSFIDKTVNNFIDSNGVCEIGIIIAGDYNTKFRDICSNHKLIAVKTLRNDFD